MFRISAFVGLLVLCIIQDSLAGDCPNIIKKKEWGGRPAKAVDFKLFQLKTSLSITQSARNEYHMDRLDYDDIGYNFLVGNDGNVYEGCGWHKVGAHTYGYNRISMAIAFVGNFDDELPSQSALNAVHKLLHCGVKKGELHRRYKLVGARQISATDSPGRTLYIELQDWDHYKNKL
uniref:Peptidoglycan-recognition protein n=1 Tax=Megaselia scalaris TaxID=36166 RepID=T1GQY8_MEGSC